MRQLACPSTPGRAGIVFFRSAPAQNALSPAPVTIATQIDGLSRTSVHASDSAPSVSGSSAFIASGRSIVTVATRSATSNRTVARSGIATPYFVNVSSKCCASAER